MAKKQWYIKGIPVPNGYKLIIMSVFLLLLIINRILPIFFTVLDYPGRGWVSLSLLGLALLFSIGSKTAEGLIIGLSLFAILSNIWDFSVFDISPFRKQVFLGSIVVLTIALVFGKISVLNLIAITRRQFGAKA